MSDLQSFKYFALLALRCFVVCVPGDCTLRGWECGFIVVCSCFLVACVFVMGWCRLERKCRTRVFVVMSGFSWL